MTRAIRSIVLIGTTLAFATQAAEQPLPGDRSAGRRLAEEHCSGCRSPASGRMSFAAIARLPSTTALSLHAFLLTSHPTMPNFKLNPEQVDDVVAYILALQAH